MTVEEVRKSLDQVEDPELKLSIIELGLVYYVRLEAREEGQHVEVGFDLDLAEVARGGASWRRPIAPHCRLMALTAPV